MPDDERLFTIPLRAVKRVPRTKRANRAVSEIKRYVLRHMKVEADEDKTPEVWIDPPVNEAVWSRSRQKPPPRIRVKAIKFEDGVIEVSLPESEAGSKREAQAEAREKAREEPAEEKPEIPSGEEKAEKDAPETRAAPEAEEKREKGG